MVFTVLTVDFEGFPFWLVKRGSGFTIKNHHLSAKEVKLRVKVAMFHQTKEMK